MHSSPMSQSGQSRKHASGDFRAGLMAAWLGTIPAVMVGGVGALIVVAASRKIFNKLYRVETFEMRR